MRNHPLLAACVAKKFGAGHEEDAPSYQPLAGLALAVSASQMCGVGVGKKVEDLRAVAVHFLQPRLRSLLIVTAVEPPMVQDVKIALKIQQQIVAGHDAAGEEVPCHPVAGIARLKRIRELPMGEDVDEEQSVRLHPRRDAR